MKLNWGKFIIFLSLAMGIAKTAQALPNNCATDSKKLAQLARQARQLPPGFDQDIFGNWQHATKVWGHDVKIKVGKYKSGQFKIGLKVKGWAENFEEENPMTICTTNQSAFDVYAKLNGENQKVSVEVLNPNKINLLDGKLSGFYNRQR